MFDKWKKSEKRLSVPVENGKESNEAPQGIDRSLSKNIFALREMFGQSFDLVIKESEVNNIKIAFAALDGMYDGLHASQAVVEPVLNLHYPCSNPRDLYEHICTFRASECDSKEAITITQAAEFILSGFVVIFVDGVDVCRAYSVQGYPKRSIEPPESESQENGSREGFADMYKDNVTLVRRRLKSPYVRFETITAGSGSNTSLCVCYHAERADPEIVNSVIDKLKNMQLDIIPGAGAVRPFLESKRISFFSSVGTTERPDVFAAKIAEGRVGIIVDGTPYALIVPHLFIENFHSLDD